VGRFLLGRVRPALAAQLVEHVEQRLVVRGPLAELGLQLGEELGHLEPRRRVHGGGHGRCAGARGPGGWGRGCEGVKPLPRGRKRGTLRRRRPAARGPARLAVASPAPARSLTAQHAPKGRQDDRSRLPLGVRDRKNPQPARPPGKAASGGVCGSNHVASIQKTAWQQNEQIGFPCPWGNRGHPSPRVGDASAKVTDLLESIFRPPRPGV